MIYALGVCVCFEPMNISLPVRLVNSLDAFSYIDGIYRRRPREDGGGVRDVLHDCLLMVAEKHGRI